MLKLKQAGALLASALLPIGRSSAAPRSAMAQEYKSTLTGPERAKRAARVKTQKAARKVNRRSK
jgi:hypothetical protein